LLLCENVKKIPLFQKRSKGCGPSFSRSSRSLTDGALSTYMAYGVPTCTPEDEESLKKGGHDPGEN
jgi:hypothetical protein